jgi:hypothetical protein
LQPAMQSSRHQLSPRCRPCMPSTPAAAVEAAAAAQMVQGKAADGSQQQGAFKACLFMPYWPCRTRL